MRAARCLRRRLARRWGATPRDYLFWTLPRDCALTPRRADQQCDGRGGGPDNAGAAGQRVPGRRRQAHGAGARHSSAFTAAGGRAAQPLRRRAEPCRVCAALCPIHVSPLRSAAEPGKACRLKHGAKDIRFHGVRRCGRTRPPVTLRRRCRSRCTPGRCCWTACGPYRSWPPTTRCVSRCLPSTRLRTVSPLRRHMPLHDGHQASSGLLARCTRCTGRARICRGPRRASCALCSRWSWALSRRCVSPPPSPSPTALERRACQASIGLSRRRARTSRTSTRWFGCADVPSCDECVQQVELVDAIVLTLDSAVHMEAAETHTDQLAIHRTCEHCSVSAS